MTKLSKQNLRASCIGLRKQVSITEQNRVSALICERIRGLSSYRAAKHIALYQAVNGEIDLSQLRLSPTHNCYFPVIQDDKTLIFLPATSTTVFYKNKFGILEPNVLRAFARRPNQLDIIFLPLVAFDEYGTRMGMGGGFYDRTLANERPSLLIGVGYEFQRQSFIEPAAWDVPLAAVITEAHTYWSK